MDELTKIKLLKLHGFDPMYHDVKDNGDIVQVNVPIRAAENTQPQEVQPTVGESSLLGSLGRAIPRSIIPTAAGLGVTGAALTALGAGESATGVGILPGLATMGLGAGSSFLASKLQDKLMPESQTSMSQRQVDYEKHPFATMAGEIAPSLVALKPSAGLFKALGELPQVLRGGAMSLPGKAALMNAGVGAGVNTGIDAAMQLALSEGIDPKRLLGAMVGGGLLNEPTRLGRRIGLPSTESMPIERPKSEAELARTITPPLGGELQGPPIDYSGSKASVNAEVPPNMEFNKNVQVKDGVVYQKDDQGVWKVKGKSDTITEAPTVGTKLEGDISAIAKPPETKKNPELMTPEEGQKYMDENMINAVLTDKGNVIAKNAEHGDLMPTLEESGSTFENPNARGWSLVGHKAKDSYIGVQDLEPHKGEFHAAYVEKAIKQGKDVNAQSVDKYSIKLPEGYGKQGDIYTKNTNNLEQKGQNVQFSESSKLVPKLEAHLEELGVPPSEHKSITVGDYLKLAEKRGVKGEVGVVAEKPEAAGVAYLKERLSRINPDAEGFGVDTPLHEVGHVFFRDLENHGTSFEKRLVSEGKKLFGSEEKAVDAFSVQGTVVEPVAKAWLKDFWSHVKARFGQANDKDIARLLSRKLLDDPAFHESHLGKRYGDEVRDFKMFQLKSEIPEHEVLTMSNPSPKAPPEQKSGFFKLAEAMTDRVKRVSPKLGEALSERARMTSRFIGDFVEKYNLKAASNDFTKQEMDNVKQWRYNRYHRLENPIQLTEHEKLANSVMNEAQQREIRQIANDSGIEVKDTDEHGNTIWRKGGYNDQYDPSIASKDFAAKMRQIGPEREALIEKVARWWEGQAIKYKMKDYGYQEALEDANNYAAALGGDRTIDNVLKFNAMRRAEGMGLPWGVIEQDGLVSMKRYGERAARDIAHHITVESQPEIRSMLNEPDQRGSKEFNDKSLKSYSGTEEVQAIQKFHSNIKPVFEQVLQSVSRAVTAAFIGPISGMRNIMSSWAASLPSTQMSQLGLYGKAVMNVITNNDSGWRSSFELGVNRANPLNMEFGASHVNGISEAFNKVAAVLSKYQGRQLLEQFDRAVHFTYGELLAVNNLGLAAKGNVESIKFLEKYGKGVKLDVSKVLQEGVLNPEQLKEIAAAFVENTQGTYDERGIPSIAAQGAASPFLSLSKWSIEKSNTIYKDVVQPLLSREKGSVERLLLYSLGSVLAGEAIQQIANTMNNKLSYDQDLIESSKSRFSTSKDYAVATVNMMQLAGLAGIVGDFVKLGIDWSQGKPGQGYNYPLAQFVSDNVVNVLRDWSNAIDAGQPVFDSTQDAIVDILRNTVQSARIAYNWVNQEETYQKNIRRDQRVFKEQAGLPVGDLSNSKAPDITGKSTRQFKQTTDISKAIQLMPEVVDQAVRKDAQSPEGLKQALRGLQQMSVSEFPSLENNPQQFGQFLQFLTGKYGEAKAQELASYYQKRLGVQEVKKNLLPKP